MSSSVSIDYEVVADVRNYWTEEVDMINQWFIKANNSEKIILLKTIWEFVNPSSFSLIEPEVKIKNVARILQKIEA